MKDSIERDESARALFPTPGHLVHALLRLRDCYDPNTVSVMLVGAGEKDPHGEPFRPGFISHFDERAALQERLFRLEPRERLLVWLWYVEGRPVTQIARALHISRVHCYRLKRTALQTLLDETTPRTNVEPSLAVGTA